MKSVIFLILIIMLSIVVTGFNLYKSNLFIASLNVLLLSMIIIFSLEFGRAERKEGERYNYEYDYDRENPNALVTGYNVAGTVYSSYPNGTPGLGWVL